MSQMPTINSETDAVTVRSFKPDVQQGRVPCIVANWSDHRYVARLIVYYRITPRRCRLKVAPIFGDAVIAQSPKLRPTAKPPLRYLQTTALARIGRIVSTSEGGGYYWETGRGHSGAARCWLLTMVFFKFLPPSPSFTSICFPILFSVLKQGSGV